MATATRKTSTRTTKKAPAPKPEPAAPVATGQHRQAVLEELSRLGWDGPTSYTAAVLRDDLLPWVAAGRPADAANVPAGAMNHAHPKPKAAKAKRLSSGYLAACADILNLLDAKGDVRGFVTERLANGEAAV